MRSVEPEPISPELALVCPELRARAIASLVEEEEAARELEHSRPRGTQHEYALMWSIASAEDDEDEWVAPLPVAVLAYAAASAAKLTVEAAAVIGVLVGALSIVTVLHS